MELTKISVLKLTIVSAGAAALCLVSVAFLGLSFSKYWTYVANEKDATDRLSNLRQEIGQMENDIADKRDCVQKINVEYARYVLLTNSNAEAENESRLVDAQIATRRETLNKLSDDTAAAQTKLDTTAERRNDAEVALKKLKDAIVEGEKRSVELSGVEEALVQKRQEAKGVEAAISEKQTKLDRVSNDLTTTEGSLVKAQTNLTLLIERAAGAEKIIGLRKDTIASMEKQIEALEARKKALSKDVDDLEKTMRIQSPKEKKLMDRLASLAGDYQAATNKLAETKLQLKKEIAEAQKELDVEIALKNQDADTRLEKARKALKDAEERAAKIVADAKSTAQEIEKKAGVDKEASEAAAKTKLSAESAAVIADQKRKDSEAKDKEAKSSLQVVEKSIADAKTKLASVQKNITERNLDLAKIQNEVKSLQELEKSLSESIAAKKKSLESLSITPNESK